MMRIYALGFMFDEAKANVLLIRKGKPDWQKGLLNGIGGRVEDSDDTFHHGMIREFREETGVDTLYEDWNLYGELCGPDFRVLVFRSVGDICSAKLVTDEHPVVISCRPLPEDVPMVANIRWLIPAAIDRGSGAGQIGPSIITAKYDW